MVKQIQVVGMKGLVGTIEIGGNEGVALLQS
jgi:hypothetical protein